MQFTYAEKTVRRLDKAFIIKQASDVCAEKNIPMCCDIVHRIKENKLFTVVEASYFIEEIVNDSVYYAYG